MGGNSSSRWAKKRGRIASVRVMGSDLGPQVVMRRSDGLNCGQSSGKGAH